LCEKTKYLSKERTRVGGIMEWNRYLSKEVEEDQKKLGKTFRYNISYMGLLEDKAIDRNDWGVRIHVAWPHIMGQKLDTL